MTIKIVRILRILKLRLLKIEKEFSCKLIADNVNDTVNGGISILHDFNDHKIAVNFYEKDETRNNLPTLKKLSKIPTESEIKKAI